MLSRVLNEILHGQASVEAPAKSDPYRTREVTSYAECATCHQPFPSGNGTCATCPACLAVADRAMQRELDAAAARGRRNNIVVGALLLALGVVVTVFTYEKSSVWVIAIGPMVAGLAGLFRGLAG
jgi:hypothetical protein